MLKWDQRTYKSFSLYSFLRLLLDRDALQVFMHLQALRKLFVRTEQRGQELLLCRFCIPARHLTRFFRLCGSPGYLRPDEFMGCSRAPE